MLKHYKDINIVLKGKYVDCKIKDGEIIYKYDKYKLSSENIISYTVIDKLPYVFDHGIDDMYCIIEIVWRDDDKSLIYIDSDNYLNLIIATH